MMAPLDSHNDHAFLIADAREMRRNLGFVPLMSSQRLRLALPSSRHCQTTINSVVTICQTSTAIQCDLLQPSCFGISACLHPRANRGDTARKGGSSQIPETVSNAALFSVPPYHKHLNSRKLPAPRHPMQPKLFAVPFRLAKSKALLACGSKSIRFLPPRSVIGSSQLRSASARSATFQKF